VRVVFCGVGALGSTSVVLCRSLPIEMALVDFDRVESKNLLAQAFVKQSVGKNKAEALKAQLHNFHGVKAEAFGVRLGEENVATLLGGAGLVVDAFDNRASREILSAHARTHGTPLVHAAIAADATFGIVRWDERFVADAEDAAGQTTCEGGEHLPFIGVVAGALARVVQDFVARGARRDVMIGLEAVTALRT
jgi:hypothetical protein